MPWYQHTFRLPSFRRGFHLVTHLIEQEVPELAKINVRLAHIFIHHTSAGLTLNENADPTVRVDFESHFNVLVPENAPAASGLVEDQEVELTPRKVFLLERLAQQPNEIISLVEMVKATHNLDTDSQEAGQLLRPFIRTLRRKLEFRLGRTPCMKNVRSRGYLLIAEMLNTECFTFH